MPPGKMRFLLLLALVACASGATGATDTSEAEGNVLVVLFPSKKTCLEVKRLPIASLSASPCSVFDNHLWECQEGIKATQCSQPCLAECFSTSCTRSCLCACDDAGKLLLEEQREIKLIEGQSKMGVKLASEPVHKAGKGVWPSTRAMQAHAAHKRMMVDQGGFNWGHMYQAPSDSAEERRFNSPFAREANKIDNVYDPIYDPRNVGPPKKAHKSWWRDNTAETMDDSWWQHSYDHKEVDSERKGAADLKASHPFWQHSDAHKEVDSERK